MEFEETKFMSYVDNIFIKILHAIMFDKVDTIDHFVGDKVYNELKEKIENLNNRNLIQMYEMTNVKESHITSNYIENDKSIIEVSLIGRYITYTMNKDTKEVYGDDTNRIEERYILTFEKIINTKEQGISRKCPGCGANMDINNNGKCEYCGAIYDLENYDYILVDIKKI